MKNNNVLGGALSLMLDGVVNGIKMGVKTIFLDLLKEKTKELEKKVSQE